MSLLKSINTSSTISIMLLSVTLKPFINLETIFFFSNSLLILGPPPCTTIIESPNFFKTCISEMKLLNTFLSISTFPPYLITISSFSYFDTYYHS